MSGARRLRWRGSLLDALAALEAEELEAESAIPSTSALAEFPDWEEEITFHPEKHLVGEERLKHKEKGGSKRKVEETQEAAQQLELPLEDEKLMEALLG